MSEGRSVFPVDRRIWDDPDFAPEPFTEREAWLWLVSKAAWKDGTLRGNTGGAVAIKRTEFSVAVRFMAEKWRWSKSKVDRFIQKLENRDMIRDTSRDGAQIYSIKNYNHFHVVGIPKRDANRDGDRDGSGTAAGQQRDKEETGKQGNKETEQQEAPAGAGDLFPVLRETSKALVVVQSLPDWLPLDAWNGYLQMRKKIRMANTDRAISILLKKLTDFRARGHDPTAILDEATTKNWKSLYEPKMDQGHGHSRQGTANRNNLAGAALAIQSLNADDEQFGQAAGDSDAGGPLLPLLDAGFHARTGSG